MPKRCRANYSLLITTLFSKLRKIAALLQCWKDAAMGTGMIENTGNRELPLPNCPSITASARCLDSWLCPQEDLKHRIARGEFGLRQLQGLWTSRRR